MHINLLILIVLARESRKNFSEMKLDQVELEGGQSKLRLLLHEDDFAASRSQTLWTNSFHH